MLLLNIFLLFGTLLSFVFIVMFLKKSPYDNWLYISLVIAIGFLGTFLIVNYVTH